MGAPSTRIKYVNSSLPITTGAAKSHQRAYVLHPAIVTGVTLGEDEYFVLGDNRNQSEDSRFADMGNVKLEDIEGKV